MKPTLYLIIGLLLTLTVSAANFEAGDEITLENVSEGNTYVAGSIINVYEDINGDFISAGNTILIEADINGDTWIAANTITINEPINGDLRVAGSTITINDDINGDLLASGSNILIAKGVTITGDVDMAAAIITIDGDIEGTLNAEASRISTRGTFDEDAELRAETLVIYGTTKFREDLTYQNSIPIEDIESIVEGEVTYEGVLTKTKAASNTIWDWFIFFLIITITGLILGHLCFNTTTRTIAAGKKWWWTLLVGLAGLIGLPIIGIVLLATVIGIPLGLIVLFAYAALLFLAFVATAGWLGNILISKTIGRMTFSIGMVLGALLLIVLMSIPILGVIVSLVALIGGLGALLMSFAGYPKTKGKTKKKR